MPTRARRVIPSRSGRRSASGSKVAGSKSLRPVAMTRRPFAPRRSFSARKAARMSSSTGRTPGQVRRDHVGAAGEQLVRRALDEAADDVPARLVLHAVEGGHHLVGGVERAAWRPAGSASRVATAPTPPFSARTTSAPSVGSPIRAPSLTTASEASTQGSRNASSGTSASPRDARDRALDPVAGAGDRVAAAGDRHLDGRHLVEGQGAGLVGVDRRGGPQGLDRAQLLDDGAGLGQLSGCRTRGSW